MPKAAKSDNRTSVDQAYQVERIVRERLVWALKPIIIVCLIVWCLHPTTTKVQVVDKNAMLGFLMGAFFAIFINRKVLHYYLFQRRKNTRLRKNRVPDEFYFGDVKRMLFSKAKD